MAGAPVCTLGKRTASGEEREVGDNRDVWSYKRMKSVGVNMLTGVVNGLLRGAEKDRKCCRPKTETTILDVILRMFFVNGRGPLFENHLGSLTITKDFKQRSGLNNYSDFYKHSHI